VLRQYQRRLIAGATGRNLGVGAKVDAAAEEGPGGEHQRRALEAAPVAVTTPETPRAVREQAGHHSLRELQARKSLEQRPHGPAVQRAVALARGAQTAGPLERLSILNWIVARSVPAPDAAEGIDLAHHSALRDPPMAGLQDR